MGRRLFFGKRPDYRPRDDVLLQLLDKAGLRHPVKELVKAVDRFRVKVLQERRGEVAVDFQEAPVYKAISNPRDLLS